MTGLAGGTLTLVTTWTSHLTAMSSLFLCTSVPARSPGCGLRRPHGNARGMDRDRRGPLKAARPQIVWRSCCVGGSGCWTVEIGFRVGGGGCAECSALGGEGGGYEGKNSNMCLKWASNFWLCVQNVIFPLRIFFGFGWVGGLAWVGGSARPPPPPPPHGQAHPWGGAVGFQPRRNVLYPAPLGGGRVRGDPPCNRVPSVAAAERDAPSCGWPRTSGSGPGGCCCGSTASRSRICGPSATAIWKSTALVCRVHTAGCPPSVPTAHSPSGEGGEADNM